jgi:hypothetical protein
MLKGNVAGVIEGLFGRQIPESLGERFRSPDLNLPPMPPEYSNCEPSLHIDAGGKDIGKYQALNH